MLTVVVACGEICGANDSKHNSNLLTTILVYLFSDNNLYLIFCLLYFLNVMDGLNQQE